MDFSSSIKKTFGHGRKISLSNIAEEDSPHEQQPILSDHDQGSAERRRPTEAGPSEVIVKIDGDGSDDQSTSSAAATPRGRSDDIGRDSSLEFWRNGANRHIQQQQQQRDPPSKLIGQFLNKQKAAGGELCLDMDLDMDELRGGGDGSNSSSSTQDFPPTPKFKCGNKDFQNFQPSKEVEVLEAQNPGASNVVDIGPDEQDNNSWEDTESSCSSDEDSNPRLHNRRRSPNSQDSLDNSGDDGRVLKCTSTQRRFGSFGKAKTRSRLIDHQPEIMDKRSGTMTNKSGPRSGFLGRVSGVLGKSADDEEDDPLFGEDLPDDYKKTTFDAWTIAQWISLVLLVTTLVCTLFISKWKEIKLRGMSLWKWEVLILVLICGRLVSGWGIKVVVFFIERNFFMRKRILYFVYGVRMDVQNCIWLGLVLLAWHYLFHRKEKWRNEFLWYVNKLMVCMLFGTTLWLAKTLMVKVLASLFHVSTFFDRIHESLFNQYVIETLSGPPLVEMNKHQEEEDRTIAEVWRLQNAGAVLPPDLASPSLQRTKSGKSASPGGKPKRVPGKLVSFKIVSGHLVKDQNDPGISIQQLHRLNPKNVSAWNMKRLIKVVKNGVLTTLDEHVVGTSNGDEKTTQIRSEREAIRAARKIFRNVAKPKAKFIYLEDLMTFLEEEEALKTFDAIEGTGESQKINKASLKNWVVNAFLERRALALTLNDTKTAVNKLHRMVNIIVGVIIFVIWLVILEIATSKFLLYISSQIVVVTFIFGNTCKTIFEAIIFVFVMHPFDVGDRCEVDGVQMIVEEMNILTTIFLRYDNQKIMYPNVTLAARPIGNFYRSPDMGDAVEFTVHIATPAEKIALMKQRITSYIENRSDHWYPSPTIMLMDFDNISTLRLSVWLRHRMNYQNVGEKFRRRALLIEELIKIFKELDIEYRLYPLDINVRAMPHINSNRMPPMWSHPPGD